MNAGAAVLDPRLAARLGRLRLGSRRRVEGRYAGAHASRRHGSSLDFADYREYVPGDDLRRVDPHAHARLGRLLVKLYEAEDESALRVVLDASDSMRFGGKAAAARAVTAGLAVVAAAGGDRVRILVVDGGGVDAGPWLRGPGTLPAAGARLTARLPDGRSGAGGSAAGRPAAGRPPAVPPEPAGTLVAAIRRARGEGPLGPVVVVSDLLFDGWEEVIAALGATRGDAVLVHLLGRRDLDPDLAGDLRLADAETGAEVEVGIGEQALRAYAATRDAWLDEVARTCGHRGVLRAVCVDDTDTERFFSVALAGLGVVRR